MAVHGRLQSSSVGELHVGEDSFHSASATGEGRVDELLVGGPVPVGDQPGREAVDGEDAAVDARLRGERVGRDPFDEAEVEPGAPLCGHHRRPAHSGAFACDLPLGEEHRCAPRASAQQSPEDGRGEVEGQVADDHLGVEPSSQSIGVLDSCAGESV
ncbi:Uncharacterised protein [Mycobacteroides abscessus subsp. abscessus]|nr:Uncharacterised protein [Mycobacteroides abscessus subsp. abscessus]